MRPSQQGATAAGYRVDQVRPPLAITRYCFPTKLYCVILVLPSLILVLPSPTCIAYPIAILSHGHCAAYAPPTKPPVFTPYTIRALQYRVKAKSALPWRVFFGHHACIEPVSRRYLVC